MPKKPCKTGCAPKFRCHSPNGPEIPIREDWEDQWGNMEWDREPSRPPKSYRREDMMPEREYDYEEEIMPARFWEGEHMMKRRHHHCPDDDKKDFCQMVEDAIVDEIGAVSMYAAMANMVDDPLLKALILSIAGDEYGHAKFWLAVLALSDC